MAVNRLQYFFQAWTVHIALSSLGHNYSINCFHFFIQILAFYLGGKEVLPIVDPVEKEKYIARARNLGAKLLGRNPLTIFEKH